MYHFVLASQFRVFVFQCIETMRAGCYYFFDTIIIQYLDILVSHHLEHEFITGPANRVAGAHFFFPKDGIINTNFIKDGYKCFCDLLCPLIKTTGTAYPK